MHPDLKGRGYMPLRGAKAAEAASSSYPRCGKETGFHPWTAKPTLSPCSLPSPPQGQLFSSHGFQPVDRHPRRLLCFFRSSPSGALERRSIAPQRGSKTRKQGWGDARRPRVGNPWLQNTRASGTDGARRHAPTLPLPQQRQGGSIRADGGARGPDVAQVLEVSFKEVHVSLLPRTATQGKGQETL